MEFSEEFKFGIGFHGYRAPSLHDLKELITRTPHLKHFEYYCEDCDDESRFTSVEQVSAAEAREHEEKCPVHCLQTLAESCPELTTLVLQCRPPTSVTINTLVSRCTMLSSLSLYKIGGSDSSPYMPFARLSHLSVLELQDCKWVDGNLISAIARGEARLRCLYLHDLVNASDDAVCLLLKSNTETLVSLSLALTNSSGFTYFTVSRCTSLKSFNVCYGKSISFLPLRKLSALPALEKLYLSDLSSLEPLQVEHIILTGGFKNLKEVYFTECNSLDDFDLVAVVREAHQLSVLYVDACRNITGFALSASVGIAKNLIAIHLFSIDLRDLSFLVDISKELPTLRLLTMYRCRVESSFQLSHLIFRERRRTLKIYTHQDPESYFCLNVLPNLPAFQCWRLGVKYDLFDLSSHARLPPNIPYEYRPADQC